MQVEEQKFYGYGSPEPIRQCPMICPIRLTIQCVLCACFENIGRCSKKKSSKRPFAPAGVAVVEQDPSPTPVTPLGLFWAFRTFRNQKPASQPSDEIPILGRFVRAARAAIENPILQPSQHPRFARSVRSPACHPVLQLPLTFHFPLCTKCPHMGLIKVTRRGHLAMSPNRGAPAAVIKTRPTSYRDP